MGRGRFYGAGRGLASRGCRCVVSGVGVVVFVLVVGVPLFGVGVVIWGGGSHHVLCPSSAAVAALRCLRFAVAALGLRLFADVTFVLRALRVRRRLLAGRGGTLAFTLLAYGSADDRTARFLRVPRWHRPRVTVGLLAGNGPAFVCGWMALMAIGARPALLGTELRPAALRHCVKVCGARAVLLFGALEPIVAELRESGVSVWVIPGVIPGPVPGRYPNGAEPLNDASEPDPKELMEDGDVWRPSDMGETALYIFTSGTTGLPKAARVSHLKALLCCGFYQLLGAHRRDVLYVALPLHHTAGALLGIAGCVGIGGGGTGGIGVGVIGGVIGMGGDMGEGRGVGRVLVWGGVGRKGVIGMGGLFSPFEIVRFDVAQGAPVRDEKGRCIRVRPGEPGLLVAPVTPRTPFLGYVGSRAQSEQKLLRDVFVEGDTFFSTGDLMEEDELGFVRFCDRTGDTFRWKGENVSTTEVAEALLTHAALQEAAVYGVTVPGHEGRAGMAAVVLRPGWELDGAELFQHVAAVLPPYAWPRFIRLQERLEVTPTFKQLKSLLAQDGFDPTRVPVPLLLLDVAAAAYVPMGREQWDGVVTGRIRI
uniref:long-chain-fatty-acid--CoA ligase n=1 Tax=Coturnix japonica TaxID=93934 RepID=A0A8C2TU01_COTJA